MGQPNFPRFLGKTQVHVNQLNRNPSTFAVVSSYLGINTQRLAKANKTNSSDILLARYECAVVEAVMRIKPVIADSV